MYNYNVYDSGRCHHGIEFADDVICKWEEPINEEKLNRLASQRFAEFVNSSAALGVPNDHFEPWVEDVCIEFYKDGYKAKEE